MAACQPHVTEVHSCFTPALIIPSACNALPSGMCRAGSFLSVRAQLRWLHLREVLPDHLVWSSPSSVILHHIHTYIYIYNIYIYVYIYNILFISKNHDLKLPSVVYLIVCISSPDYKGFPHSSVGKESACNSGDPGLMPGLGRSPGEENDNPLQYSCLEKPHGQRSWQAIVHGVTRVRHYLETQPPPDYKLLESRI